MPRQRTHGLPRSTPPVGRSRARRSVAAALTCATALVLSSCALSLQSLPKISGVSSGTYPIYAAFSNVLNLPDDAQVRVGAQVVGQVGAISTKNFQADLTLDVEQAVHLPVGTTAQVRFDDPLGDEYVLLEPPTVPANASRGEHPIPGSRGPDPRELDRHGTKCRGHIRCAVPRSQRWGNQPAPNHHRAAQQDLQRQSGADPLILDHDRQWSELPLRREAAIDGALASISNLSSKLNGGRATIATGIEHDRTGHRRAG